MVLATTKKAPPAAATPVADKPKAAKATAPVAIEPPAKRVATPTAGALSKAPKAKHKLVRDSFTMPHSDFELSTC